MENKLEKIEEIDVSVISNPEDKIKFVHKAAKALVKFMSARPKPILINGERYLEFEEWQVLGGFFGLTAGTGETESVEIDGIKGVKAKAYIYNKQGIIVGTSEAYCMRDEYNWKTKPFFQLASMAQTRAGAKAFRSILSNVVVMAGYKPTPAEEIKETALEQELSANEEIDQKQQDIYLSKKQFNFIDRLVKEQGLNPKELAQKFGGVEFITQLTKVDASKLIDYLMTNKVKSSPASRDKTTQI